MDVIKTATSILIAFGVCVVFWCFASRKESELVSPDDAEEPIFILEGDKVVEVLDPAMAQFPEKADAIANQQPAKNKEERINRGRRVYNRICIACHQPNGQGVPTIFPPLAKSDFLNSDKQRAISIVANGLVGEIEVNGKKFHNLMPKPGLNDEEIANVLTFVYSQWDNNGSEVTPDEVKTIRNNEIKGQAK